MLAAENWCVKVDDKIYGPYSSQQMRKFAHEGRLASWSLIAPAGSRAWCEAYRESTFSSFFGVEPQDGKSFASNRTFGKRITANDEVVESGEVKNQPSLANFVIIFDVVSASASRVEAAVLGLGNAFRIAENVWHVTCELTAVGVRNAVAPYLTPSESIFVVDTTRGKSSWQNYAPECRSKITAAYAHMRPQS